MSITVDLVRGVTYMTVLCDIVVNNISNNTAFIFQQKYNIILASIYEIHKIMEAQNKSAVKRSKLWPQPLNSHHFLSMP